MSDKQYGFMIDTARCTGCKTCQLACKDYKDLSPEVNFRRVYEYAGGDWNGTGESGQEVWEQNVFAYQISISCNHCDDPACTKVCPTGAMAKREHGLVSVDEQMCIGCKSCAKACPYGAPQFNAEKKKMTKCNGCLERLQEGKGAICVEACPLRALEFGPIDELRNTYGDKAAIAPLVDASITSPNLVIQAGRNARESNDTTGHLANPEEVKIP